MASKKEQEKGEDLSEGVILGLCGEEGLRRFRKFKEIEVFGRKTK